MTDSDAAMTDTPSHPPAPASEQSTSSTKRGLGVAAVVVIALVVGFLVWLLVIRDDNSATTAQPNANARAATEIELRDLQDKVGHPIYWIGSDTSKTYELTKLRNGNIYIRYLPEGVEIGDPKPGYTTVGTYLSPNAFEKLVTGSKRKDATSYRFESGAIAVTYSGAPSSVFFAFPNQPYTVEVFDPSPERALALVKSGQVQPLP